MDDNHILDEMFKDTPKVSNTGRDEIICIVDVSGSMSSIREDAQGGLNEFIREQAEVEGGANLTLVEFESTVREPTYDRIDINEAEEYKLRPSGGTALLDALGMTINKYRDYEGDGKVIVVVVTDGGENASREYTRDTVFDLITEMKDKGWEFMFLAANQDAIQTGASYGFDANASVNFAASSKGVKSAYYASSTYTTSLRTKSKLEALDDLKKVVDEDEDISQ